MISPLAQLPVDGDGVAKERLPTLPTSSMLASKLSQMLLTLMTSMSELITIAVISVINNKMVAIMTSVASAFAFTHKRHEDSRNSLDEWTMLLPVGKIITMGYCEQWFSSYCVLNGGVRDFALCADW